MCVNSTGTRLNFRRVLVGRSGNLIGDGNKFGGSGVNVVRATILGTTDLTDFFPEHAYVTDFREKNKHLHPRTQPLRSKRRRRTPTTRPSYPDPLPIIKTVEKYFVRSTLLRNQSEYRYQSFARDPCYTHTHAYIIIIIKKIQ